MDAHPESFQLEKVGTRVFANVPDKQEVEVADLIKGKVLARWRVTACTTNFPMSLDEAHHRLFVGCRFPAKLVVFDTESGKIVASLATVDIRMTFSMTQARAESMFSVKVSSTFGKRKTPIATNGFSAFLHLPTRARGCLFPT